MSHLSARPLHLVTIAVILLIGVMSGAVPGERTASAQTPPFSGILPAEGVALLAVTEATSSADLAAALRAQGCGVRALVIYEDGSPHLYTPDAPAFVNAGFPVALPAGQLFLVRCEVILEGDFVLLDAVGLGSGGFAEQSDVRAASHAGYDRFVVEFEEDVIPTYAVEYVTDTQFTCGQGAPVTVAGNATLRLHLTNARIHNEAGQMTIPTRTLAPGLPAIKEAREICGFEGHVTWLLGLQAERPFRMFILQNPARIVIDIPTASPPAATSGAAGVVWSGPVCPVVQEGQNCPDRLAEVTLTFGQNGDSQGRVEAVGGRVTIDLPAGTYEVNLAPGSPVMPSMGAQTIVVPPNQRTWFEVRLDSGIR
ncbi:MAG: hypothetical protein Q7K37_00205 [Dehalococcoidia bacterium]|nr:hypothetical protein [Dehalococcoidia bacterium]